MTEKKKKLGVRIRHNLRTKLLAGVIALVPIGITFLILRFIFNFVESLAEPAVLWVIEQLADVGFITQPPFTKVLEYSLVGVGVISTVVAVYLVGVLTTILTANILGRRMVGLWNSLLARIPLVRSIYTASKQIIESVASTDKMAFKRVVLVEYPRRGIWSIAFVTNSLHNGSDSVRFVNLFVPTAPNPTSGWMALVPEDDVVETDLTIEEAFRTVLSVGVSTPGDFSTKAIEGRHLADPIKIIEDIKRDGVPRNDRRELVQETSKDS